MCVSVFLCPSTWFCLGSKERHDSAILCYYIRLGRILPKVYWLQALLYINKFITLDYWLLTEVQLQHIWKTNCNSLTVLHHSICLSLLYYLELQYYNINQNNLLIFTGEVIHFCISTSYLQFLGGQHLSIRTFFYLSMCLCMHIFCPLLLVRFSTTAPPPDRVCFSI